jgi:hypothetical protein
MPRFLRPAEPASAPEQEADAAMELSVDAADATPEEERVGPMDGAPEEAVALPEISGSGIETQSRAHSMTLQGLTEADFSNSFATRRVRTRRASDCEGCAESDCVRVTGTLVSTFRVTTRVTLPSVSDFPDLTACQRRRVRNGITNVLAPHEQQHVVAFRTYNGTVRTPFDFTLCRDDFDGRVQELHDSVESARRASAQAASDALDPFFFEVDLDCED